MVAGALRESCHAPCLGLCGLSYVAVLESSSQKRKAEKSFSLYRDADSDICSGIDYLRAFLNRLFTKYLHTKLKNCVINI